MRGYESVSETEWRKIEDLLGGGPDESLRRHLYACIDDALDPRLPPGYGQVGGPKAAAVKKLLSRIARNASRLQEALSILDKYASTDLDVITARNEVIPLWLARIGASFPAIEKCLQQADETTENTHEPIGKATNLALSLVIAMAESGNLALQSVPQSAGGAPKDPVREELLRSLAKIYQSRTNKKAKPAAWDEAKRRYTGDFFLFVTQCLKTLLPHKYHALSDHALKSAIERILRS